MSVYLYDPPQEAATDLLILGFNAETRKYLVRRPGVADPFEVDAASLDDEEDWDDEDRYDRDDTREGTSND